MSPVLPWEESIMVKIAKSLDENILYKKPVASPFTILIRSALSFKIKRALSSKKLSGGWATCHQYFHRRNS